jgi:hypothetical protein
MAETIHIDCTAGVYTPLSAGHTNVSFKMPRIYGGRLAIAASLPSPSSVDFIPLPGSKEVALGSLDVLDNVYLMPDQDETIKVIRG